MILVLVAEFCAKFQAKKLKLEFLFNAPLILKATILNQNQGVPLGGHVAYQRRSELSQKLIASKICAIFLVVKKLTQKVAATTVNVACNVLLHLIVQVENLARLSQVIWTALSSLKRFVSSLDFSLSSCSLAVQTVCSYAKEDHQPA